MTLAVFQVAIDDLTVGDGTDYELVSIAGLEDLDVRSSDVNRPYDDGEFAGDDFAIGRTVQMVVEIHNATDSGFRADIEALQAHTLPRKASAVPITLQYLLPGMANARQITCRSRKRAIPIDLNYARRLATVPLEFHATDPNLYDTTLQTIQTTPLTASAGAPWPLHWPLAWGSAPAGSMNANNAGTRNTWPTFSVQGPATTPTLTNQATGQSLAFGVVMGALDVLQINAKNRTAQLNGVDVTSLITPSSAWWAVAPGSNTITFAAQTFSSGAQVTMQFRSAWL